MGVVLAHDRCEGFVTEPIRLRIGMCDARKHLGHHVLPIEWLLSFRHRQSKLVLP